MCVQNRKRSCFNTLARLQAVAGNELSDICTASSVPLSCLVSLGVPAQTHGSHSLGDADAHGGLLGPACSQILKKRKGFVSIALQTGAHLLPVVAFGETDLFDVSQPAPGSLLHKLQG